MYGSNPKVRFNNEVAFSKVLKTFFHMVLSYEIQLCIVSILRGFFFCVTLFCYVCKCFILLWCNYVEP
jgi:hypothetical protein